MGYACYEKDGRDQGYGIPAICDHPDCFEEIDRGIGYACGGDPMENCGLFFCSTHRSHDVDPEAEWADENRHDFGVCERCAKGEPAFTPSADTEFWRAWKMNHVTWAKWRSENAAFVEENSHLVGHKKVMSEIAGEEDRNVSWN